MFFTPKIIVSTFSHYIKCNHRKSKLRPSAFGWLTRIIMWEILLLQSFSTQLLSIITNGCGPSEHYQTSLSRSRSVHSAVHSFLLINSRRPQTDVTLNSHRISSLRCKFIHVCISRSNVHAHLINANEKLSVRFLDKYKLI